jgi:tungstate transport system permease protein
MVGGNIRGFTRVLTTTISLETARGEIPLSIALAIILLTIVLTLSLAINLIRRRA